MIEEDMFLNLTEVKKLLHAARVTKLCAIQNGNKVGVRDWFLAELSLATGLRVFEMSNLKCGDILLNNGYCHVLVRKGKGGKSRLVRISRSFAKVYNEYIAWKQSNGEPTEDDAPAFRSSHTGKCMTVRALQKAYKRLLKRAGLNNYGIHSTRHTYGTHLFKTSNNNLRLVQRQLGHSSTRVTEVYAGVFQTEAERSVDQLYQQY